MNINFDLYKRAKHVFSEAQRVWNFKEVCEGKLTQDPLDKAKLLGNLMNKSQESCRDLFECSSPELDELTNLARSLGAFGSRLTGAGWGGCCVSLIKEADLAQFVDKIQSDYYLKQREPGQQLWVSDDLNRYVFATKPGKGACVLDPKFCVWFD